LQVRRFCTFIVDVGRGKSGGEWLEIASRFCRLGEYRWTRQFSKVGIFECYITNYFVLFLQERNSSKDVLLVISHHLIYSFDPQDPTIMFSLVLPVQTSPEHDTARIQISQCRAWKPTTLSWDKLPDIIALLSFSIRNNHFAP
jgi:hypothetical protein